MSENSSSPTLLRGDPHERGVTDSTRRARQEEAARHSEAQRLSTLNQVRTRFNDQASSLQSNWGVSSDDDNDADDVQFQGLDLRPVDSRFISHQTKRNQEVVIDWRHSNYFTQWPLLFVCFVRYIYQHNITAMYISFG